MKRLGYTFAERLSPRVILATGDLDGDSHSIDTKISNSDQLEVSKLTFEMSAIDSSRYF
jgi:hypothetical protein